jgi:hypothetical protein
MINTYWIIKDVEGSGLDKFQYIILAFTWRNWIKRRNTSRTHGAPAENSNWEERQSFSRNELIKHRAMMTHGEWSYGSTNLDLGNRWKWMVGFLLDRFYPRRKNPRYPLDRTLGRTPELIWKLRSRVNFLSPAGNRTPAVVPRYTNWATPTQTGITPNARENPYRLSHRARWSYWNCCWRVQLKLKKIYLRTGLVNTKPLVQQNGGPFPFSVSGCESLPSLTVEHSVCRLAR